MSERDTVPELVATGENSVGDGQKTPERRIEEGDKAGNLKSIVETAARVSSSFLKNQLVMIIEMIVEAEENIPSALRFGLNVMGRLLIWIIV